MMFLNKFFITVWTSEGKLFGMAFLVLLEMLVCVEAFLAIFFLASEAGRSRGVCGHVVGETGLK